MRRSQQGIQEWIPAGGSVGVGGGVLLEGEGPHLFMWSTVASSVVVL